MTMPTPGNPEAERQRGQASRHTTSMMIAAEQCIDCISHSKGYAYTAMWKFQCPTYDSAIQLLSIPLAPVRWRQTCSTPGHSPSIFLMLHIAQAIHLRDWPHNAYEATPAQAVGTEVMRKEGLAGRRRDTGCDD